MEKLQLAHSLDKDMTRIRVIPLDPYVERNMLLQQLSCHKEALTKEETGQARMVVRELAEQRVTLNRSEKIIGKEINRQFLKAGLIAGGGIAAGELFFGNASVSIANLEGMDVLKIIACLWATARTVNAGLSVYRQRSASLRAAYELYNTVDPVPAAPADETQE